MLVAITAARTVGPLRKLTDLLEKREATTEQSAVPFLSRNDEVGKFARAACEVIKARRDIEEIMGKVRDFSSVIGGSSSDLHNASQVLSSRTENQKLSLERANVTLGEIAEMPARTLIVLKRRIPFPTKPSLWLEKPATSSLPLKARWNTSMKVQRKSRQLLE